MGQITLDGNPDVVIHLRRSSRAKRLSLRMSRLDGKVTMTLPSRVPEAEALAFARTKEAWLRKHLESTAAPSVVGYGSVLPIEGADRQVMQSETRGVTLLPGLLCVSGPETTLAPRLRAWLKERARARLAAASDHYSAALGRPYRKITLRDTRSRWGSCTSDGSLMYSWRLILAPPDVLDYVAAHEVAHLSEMNHSAAFWNTVEHLYGPWQPQRDWLRTQGAALHQYRFGD